MGIGDIVTNLKAIVSAIQTATATIGKVFPQTIGTATTATAGAATLPAQPAGFLTVVNPTSGATVKIPYYNS
jgi:hypothetical protein